MTSSSDMRTLAFIVSSLLAGAAIASPEGDVRATFDRYQKAMARGDANAAANEVSDSTIAYFDRIRSDALVAPDVHGLPLVDKIFVLRTRTELSAERLSAFDGRALVAFALSKHWIAANHQDRMSLGKIRVTGDRAEEQRLVNKLDAPTPFVFHRDKNRWHVDLTAFTEEEGTSLASFATSRRLTEDEVALKMLTEIIGHPVPTSVWSPVLPPRPR